MAVYDLIKEPLDNALELVQRLLNIANHVSTPNFGITFEDEVRRYRRDLPHYCQQSVKTFPGSKSLAEDLQHELQNMEEDAIALANWIDETSKRLQELYEKSSSAGGNLSDFIPEQAKTFTEANRRQGIVKHSCQLALNAAQRVCALADRALDKQPIKPAPEIAPPKPSRRASKPKTRRRRESRVAILLFELLDDRRNANLKCTELARMLKCNVSSVSRAFKHPEYGPRIMRRYHDYGVRPPGIHQI